MIEKLIRLFRKPPSTVVEKLAYSPLLLTLTTVIRLQVMVESLRVAELRSLLSTMGKDKKGLKKDLVQRATKLLHDNFHPELLSAIQELYDRRRSTGNSRRSQVIDMPTAVKVVADYPKKSSEPVHKPEVHMIELPFYQTLETIVAPKSLGTATALLRPLGLQNLIFSLGTIRWSVVACVMASGMLRLPQ